MMQEGHGRQKKISVADLETSLKKQEEETKRSFEEELSPSQQLGISSVGKFNNPAQKFNNFMQSPTEQQKPQFAYQESLQSENYDADFHSLSETKEQVFSGQKLPPRKDTGESYNNFGDSVSQSLSRSEDKVLQKGKVSAKELTFSQQKGVPGINFSTIKEANEEEKGQEEEDDSSSYKFEESSARFSDNKRSLDRLRNSGGHSSSLSADKRKAGMRESLEKEDESSSLSMENQVLARHYQMLKQMRTMNYEQSLSTSKEA